MKLRKWDNSLTHYVMAMGDPLAPGSLAQCQWSTAQYLESDEHFVNLVTDSGDTFRVTKDLASFRAMFKSKLEEEGVVDAVYSASSDEQCCIVVMGPGEIGKTALISKFVRGTFPHDYDPTIQDTWKQQIRVDVCDLYLCIFMCF